MKCRLHRTLDRSNEERDGSRVLTWSLMGTDKEVALLLTERRNSAREVEFVKFEMPLGIFLD